MWRPSFKTEIFTSNELYKAMKNMAGSTCTKIENMFKSLETFKKEIVVCLIEMPSFIERTKESTAGQGRTVTISVT